MKVIIFIESEDDCLAAKKYISDDTNRKNHFTVLNVNSSLRFDFSDYPHVSYKEEEDYFRYLDLEPLNRRALEEGRSWWFHPVTAQFLFYQGMDLTTVFEHSLVRGVTTVYKFVELFKKIFELENPEEIVVFFHKNGGPCRNIHFTENDKLADKLAPLVARSYFKERGITLREIPLETCQETQTYQNQDQPRYPLLRVLSRYVRRLGNRITKLTSDKKKRTILACGSPTILFPLLEKFLTEREYRLSYFQESTAPRLLSWLMKRGIAYHTMEDYPVEGKDGRKPGEGERKTALGQVTRLTEFLQRNRLFVYEGIDLLPAFKDKFVFLFQVLLPKVESDIDRMRKLLTTTSCGLILIDEDISYFSRSLLLTAKSLGIRTAEFQHGAITKYLLELEVADKKFVWGDYFRNRILDETPIPRSKIAVVGPAHLEHLVERRAPRGRIRDRRDIQRTLRISPDSKIVLFTPHAFHKSSKGGFLNRHNTRREAENVVSEVIKAVDGKEGVHLIIKLHHADKKPFFYQDLIAASQARAQYSIVRHLSIYKLINACDLLISPISTAVLEAMIIEKPIILMNTARKKVVFPYVEWGAVECADENGKLKELLGSILERPQESWDKVRNGRARVLAEFASGGDGKAGERLIAEVEKLMGRGTT